MGLALDPASECLQHSTGSGSKRAMHRFSDERTGGGHGDRAFLVGVERNDDETVVRVTGEIDLATAPRLEECLLELDGQAITLDLSAVTFMDATGIQVLLTTQQRKGD